jgi:hypothetical protein
MPVDERSAMLAKLLSMGMPKPQESNPSPNLPANVALPASEIGERMPYPGEMSFFKKRPDVGGMATEDNHVIINPFSSLSEDEKDSIRQNETARVFMRNNPDFRPNFEITPQQNAFFSTVQNGQPYGTPQDIRETITARTITGDPSAGQPTASQKFFAGGLNAVINRTK